MATQVNSIHALNNNGRRMNPPTPGVSSVNMGAANVEKVAKRLRKRQAWHTDSLSKVGPVLAGGHHMPGSMKLQW